MSNVNDIQALSASIAEGLASESDTGLALRTLQTAMGCRLVNTLQQVSESHNRLNELLNKCINKFVADVSDRIDSDTIPHEELFDIIKEIQTKQISFLELQRKIIQSPTKLFSDDVLSNEEKKLLTLLKSFKTPQEKADFLKAVDLAMKPSGTNEFN